MQAARLDRAVDAISRQVITQARSKSGLDPAQLQLLWAEAKADMRRQLLLDETLQVAAADFEAALEQLFRADSALAHRCAVDDVRHHAAMLEDLLASSAVA